jgi:L-amino acid N-acyltransferase YncA
MHIEAMRPAHWAEVKEIYEQGIATGNATFELNIPQWPDWDLAHLPFCRMVMIENGEVLAWAALTAVSNRCIYSGVAEVSVYVAAKWRGRGMGKKILQELILESERNNYWTLQAGIFPENKQSIKIHEQLGFRVIGTRERIGLMNGRWRDTVLLERRSQTVGI